MIRVLVVDDHPVLRAGLEAVLRAEPGFRCVGAVADSEAMRRVLGRTRPDVVVLDRNLGQEDGLDVCRRLRAEPSPPAVVLYTAEVVGLAPAAEAAGAASVVDKTRPVEELFDAIRLAGRRLQAARPPRAA